MKINISVDCTPAEAREMMGLPDVKALQEEWLKSIEEKMKSEVDKFSTEAVLESWTQGASSNMDMFAGMMNAFSGGAGKGK